MTEENKIRTVILAAGQGTRMKADLPKVLVPLKDKPLGAHVLDAATKAGNCGKPVVVVGQQRELVMQTLGNGCDYAIQTEQLGTGHAVLSAKETLKEKADHVVVLYGDHPFIRPETIRKLVETHLASHGKITLASVNLPDFEDWRKVFYANFSRLVRDQAGNIVKDVQFKDASEDEKKITEVNPCYFCFEAKWLWEKLETLKNDNAQKEYYLTDLVKIAIQEKQKIESVEIDPREALGVNSPAELEVVERLMYNK